MEKRLLRKHGLHAVAVLYTGGSIAQLAKLMYDFPWVQMPFVIDGLIVVLGVIGAVTLVSVSNNVDYRGRWEKPVHYLIIAHLSASVALHVWTIYVGNHDLYAAFPREYSYFALTYFAFFAWRSWTLRVTATVPDR